MDNVITQAEAQHYFDQQELRRMVKRHGIAAVLEWVMALRLGLPMQPWHASEHGTIGEPR